MGSCQEGASPPARGECLTPAALLSDAAAHALTGVRCHTSRLSRLETSIWMLR
jgi:hypothetical protein